MQKEYITQFPDGTLIRWRPLTWGEYNRLIREFPLGSGAADWLLYEAVAALCIIDFESDGQDSLDDLFAGTIQTIGMQILEETGFGSTLAKINSKIAEYRQRISSNYFEAISAVICHMFHYKVEDLQTWTLDKIMYHVVLAEQLGVKIEAAPIEKQVTKPQIKKPKR